MLANRERILRWMFIPQLLAAALFLTFSYSTGKVHAHLLLHSARTTGKIIALKPARIRESSSGSAFYTTIYEPLVEFAAGDRTFSVQEWKGSTTSAGIGSAVPVLYDPANPSIAMMDRGLSNWIPWTIFFIIGLPVALAGLKGFLVFLLTPLRSSSAVRTA
jgi:hypothetical protein